MISHMESYHTAKPVTYADDTSALVTARNINELQITEKTSIVKFSSKHYQDKLFESTIKIPYFLYR